MLSLSKHGRAAIFLCAVFVAAICSCSPITSTCSDGEDRGLKSTGTCGPDVTVTVKSGSSCIPSAFTGFNSELAGFPAATNNDHPVAGDVVVTDGGTETRRCVLSAAGDSGFTVTCDLCSAVDGGSADAGCVKAGTCRASLVP